MDLGLSGKIAVVTGGSRGIGRAIAERLAAEGCDLLLIARDEARLGAAAAAIAAASGRRVATSTIDLRAPDGGERAAAAAIREFGRADILVNNAGVAHARGFLEIGDQPWYDSLELKFLGYVRMCRAFWPLLKAARGSVVNISGHRALTPEQPFMIGGAIGAAANNFTKALADLGRTDDVQVNTVTPGITLTELTEGNLQREAAAEGIGRDEAERRHLAQYGLRRFCRPAEVGALVAFLASPAARYVHGVNVAIDGGLTRGL